jgi:hypothetical protein
MSRRPTVAVCLGLAVLTSLAPWSVGQLSVRSADAACRVISLDFTPSADLQIVIWLERADGTFEDTLFITDATGRFGLGNRPGIMEFNTEFLWPYGRRETVFPVWAHRHGNSYPKLVFQDGYDRDLSHAFTKSSAESYYCRPLLTSEATRQQSIDTGSCATVAFTDKGKFATGSPAPVSLYPPRRDLTYVPNTDHPDVQMFSSMNDLDAVSRATPVGGQRYLHEVSIPMSVPDGEYVVWVEVSKELDRNDSYAFPAPVLQAYGDYGVPYRGQPSVLWSAPLILGSEEHAATVLDYVGYGDPEGIDGEVRAPDATITSTTDGSGARRLLLTVDGDSMYRLRARSEPSDGDDVPHPPATMNVVSTDSTQAQLTFVEPGGAPVRAYDVRFSVGQPLTAENFTSLGRVVPIRIEPVGPGTLQTVTLTQLVPETRYWVGIRAQDDCLNGSAPTIIELVTPRFEPPAVAACFVATAAWGSPLAAEVGMLRRFRDAVLRRQVLGEIFVESYYTFGPALAAVIRPSDDLRAVSRAALAPLVDAVRPLTEDRP